MPKFKRTTTSSMSVEDTLKVISAFEKVPEWDPSCISSIRRDNTSKTEVGSVYDLKVDFLGKTVDVVYEIISLTDDTVKLHGKGDTSKIEDIMTVIANEDGKGCKVYYTANIKLDFPYHLLDCPVGVMFTKTVDEAIKGLGAFIEKEAQARAQSK